MAFWNKAYERCHAKKEKLCVQRDYASQGLQVKIAELYFIFLRKHGNSSSDISDIRENLRSLLVFHAPANLSSFLNVYFL